MLWGLAISNQAPRDPSRMFGNPKSSPDWRPPAFGNLTDRGELRLSANLATLRPCDFDPQAFASVSSAFVREATSRVCSHQSIARIPPWILRAPQRP